MKKQLLLLCLMVLTLANVKAADLLVEEFGLAPAYSSIQAAVTAAANGDRIIIKNRAGNIPWVETVTIAKSLELLPFLNDSLFIVQGNYTITMATGRTVSIIGMYNTAGNIVTGGTGASGSNAVLNVYGSQLVGGNLSATSNYVTANIYGSKVFGQVSITNGTVVGNEISNSGIALEVNSAAAANNDTIFIIGNRISSTTSNNSSYYGLNWSNNTSFFDIRNNHFSSSYYPFYIGATKASNATVNKIYNNSFTVLNYTSTGTVYCLFVIASTNSIVEVMNNVLDKNSTGTSAGYVGIYGSIGTSAQINAYFNFVDNQFTTAFGGSYTVQTNNTTNQAISLAANGALSGGIGVNGGNPANLFFDLDLTRNDVGAWGGSFTQANFFPLFTGAARTWLTSYPFNVRTGTTLSIKATSFDR